MHFLVQKQSSLKFQQCQISEMNILDLPEEVLIEIFSYITQDELLWKVAFVCTSFSKIIMEMTSILEIQAPKDNYIFSKTQKLLYLENISSSVKYLIVSRESDDKRIEELKTLKLNERRNICIFLRSRRIEDTELLYIAQKCRYIECLVLNKCCMLSFSSFNDTCSKMDRLTTLKILGSTQLTDQNAHDISSHCTQLKTIHLLDCTKITDKSIHVLSEKCHFIEDLDVHGCRKLTDRSIISIAHNVKKLRSFSIGICPYVTNSAFWFLAKNCLLLQNY